MLAAKDIFLGALEQPLGARRSSYLEEACAGDATLRGRVEELLAAHDRQDSFLEHPAVAVAPEPSKAIEGASASETPSQLHGELTQAEDSRLTDALPYLAAAQRAGSIGRLDHYEIIETIGKGGFGTVYRAFDEKLHRVVAIKVLAPELAASGTAKQRFLREARAGAAVRHEHVVDIHAVVDDGPVPYLVMEYVEGRTLHDKLEATGPLTVKEILRIGYQTACGLASAHKQGLIHRDVKPGNILLENGVERVKLTDFGLARAMDDASVTQSGVVAGTPAYMSPEQAEGKNLDHRSDLFSLGSTLYVMCTGRPPFRAAGTMAVLRRVVDNHPRPIREINGEIPDWLCDVVETLHSKKPDERYQSAQEVADVLAKFLAELQTHGTVTAVQSKRESPADETHRSTAAPAERVRRPRIAQWLVAGLGAATVIASLIVINLPRNPVVLPPHGGKLKKTTVVETHKIVGPWQNLFNGKDLTGWKWHPQQPGNWRVEEGVIVGSGPGATTHLFTERGDYEDFHLRMEVKVSAGSDSGLHFRNKFAAHLLKSDWVGGYEVNIVSNKLVAMKTGTVYHPGDVLAPVVQDWIQADVWFTLEVIAEDNEFTVKIDGNTVAECRDDGRRATRGHLSIQQFTAATKVSVRKFEVKEPSVRTARPQTLQEKAKLERQAELERLIEIARKGRDETNVRYKGQFIPKNELLEKEVELAEATLAWAFAKEDGALSEGLAYKVIEFRTEQWDIARQLFELGRVPRATMDAAEKTMIAARLRHAKVMNDFGVKRPAAGKN